MLYGDIGYKRPIQNSGHGIKDYDLMVSKFEEFAKKNHFDLEKGTFSEYQNVMTMAVFTGYLVCWRDHELMKLQEDVRKITEIIGEYTTLMTTTFKSNWYLNLKTGERRTMNDSDIGELCNDEVIERDYRANCRETIESFGGLEAVEQFLGMYPVSSGYHELKAVDEDKNDPMGNTELDHIVYGYKLCGLDNPFDLTEKAIEGYIERINHTKNKMQNLENDEDKVFSLAYVSITFTQKHTGREIVYDIDDLYHILANKKAKK